MKLPALIALLLLSLCPVAFCTVPQAFTETPAQTENETELDVASGAAPQNCSYLDVYNYLQLKEKADLFTLFRPVKNHSTATNVQLLVLVYAILNVHAVEQTFVSDLWVTMTWQNEFIRWDPEEFCGISVLFVPAETLWKPDITIDEMTEKDKSSPSPYMEVHNEGTIFYENDQVVVSTCKMNIYKFPFDIQKCSLTFRSIIFPASEITVQPRVGSATATAWTRDVMRTHDEWIFINMSSNKSNVNYNGFAQDIVIFTITMQRSSLLYIVNFLLPVLFFLCLDLASFLMSDLGGEKLGFKITALLSVTVMQLLLNDILPSSSKHIPLIAVFCIGVFSLMLLSLLETIVVQYLIHRDQMKSHLSPTEESITPNHNHEAALSASTLEKDVHVLTVLLTELLQGQREGEGYWSRKARVIHRVFFIFYITATVLFLGTLFYHWTE